MTSSAPSSSLRGRILAALVLFLVAVAGGLAALTLERFVFRPGPDGPPPFGVGPPAFTGPGHDRALPDWFARELGLSPDQRVKMDSLMDRQLREIRAVRRQVQPRLDSIVAQTRRQIDSILTPEQREKARARAQRHFPPPGGRPDGPAGPPPGYRFDRPPPPLDSGRDSD